MQHSHANIEIQSLQKYTANALLETIDNLPHGMLICRRQFWTRYRSTVVRSHDSFSQQKVSEEAGHKEILPKQLLKQICKRQIDISNSVIGLEIAKQKGNPLMYAKNPQNKLVFSTCIRSANSCVKQFSQTSNARVLQIS